MKTVIYSIPDMSCNHCVHTVKTEVEELEGVRSVEPDLATKLTTIQFEDPASEQQIKELLAEINYPAVES